MGILPSSLLSSIFLHSSALLRLGIFELGLFLLSFPFPRLAVDAKTQEELAQRPDLLRRYRRLQLFRRVCLGIILSVSAFIPLDIMVPIFWILFICLMGIVLLETKRILGRFLPWAR